MAVSSYQRSSGVTGVRVGHMAAAVTSLIVLLSPFVFYVYVKTFGMFPSCSGAPSDCADAPGFHLFVSAVWGALVSISAGAGSLGTTLSFFLRQTKPNLINADLAVEVPIAYIGLREFLVLLFFGMTFGVVMLALFLGNFVEGNLFPNLKVGSWIEVNIRVADWAKVFVWCFLAGFSERLIPNLLDNIVRHVAPRPDNDQRGSRAAVEAKEQTA